jgi:tetratricopeptide (TPR) repeat protein
VETGVPGLLLFLAALGSGFAALARRRADDDDGFRLGALLGLSALALQGFGEPLLATPGVALPALVVAGSVLAPRGRRMARRRAGTSIRVVAWGLLAGVYYLAVIAPWLGDRHYGRMLRARDGETFRIELSRALRSNPLQPYYYGRAAEAILDAVPRLEPASYRTCYDYVAKAVRLNPLDRRLLLLRAEVDRRAFQEVFRDAATLEETLEAYDAAVAAAPTDPMPAAAMAGFLLDVGRDEAALETADLALSIEPNFVRARRIRVEALRRLGRSREAAAAEADLRGLRETLRGYVPRNGYEARILGEEDGRADRP